jgi:hypothetical protein
LEAYFHLKKHPLVADLLLLAGVHHLIIINPVIEPHPIIDYRKPKHPLDNDPLLYDEPLVKKVGS